ncbi:cobyrinate a,c-diamide synthase [Candidatus Spongiihabitans sp.]|uniref:cobyrinate a,c-diamide synthase n=1 Tax=Candidatus Spongiihabitans sp. TaxID=3101308 RepID=UPI003C7DA03C
MVNPTTRAARATRAIHATRAKVKCPALFFCAPASGQGKTTITAGIARYHRNRGLDVRVFKTGPDYLDPLILERACGAPVTQIDLWMVGEAECKHILYQAACEADLILFEGAMGLFDGAPSSADLAEYFGIPIAIVMDARAMAQTFGAIALGLATHRPRLQIAGVIANALAGERHQQLISESMPRQVALLGCVGRHPDIALPERHLGLVHPDEVADIDQRLDALAEVMAQSGLTKIPDRVEFADHDIAEPEMLLGGSTIGIAKDDAFSFIYAANIKLLEQMGATCVYFSPLNDRAIPAVDALWLPGGYPELHHQKLSSNDAMRRQVKKFHASGKKILAECGGMLYLMNSLTDVPGERAEMMAVLPGDGVMRERGGCQGMQIAPLPQGELRAHAHHRTRCENTMQPIAFGKRLRHSAPGEPIYQTDNITASYLHFYFPSNPKAIAKLLS